MCVQRDASGRTISSPFTASGTVLHISFDGMSPCAELCTDLMEGATVRRNLQQGVSVTHGQCGQVQATRSVGTIRVVHHPGPMYMGIVFKMVRKNMSFRG